MHCIYNHHNIYIRLQKSRSGLGSISGLISWITRFSGSFSWRSREASRAHLGGVLVIHLVSRERSRERSREQSRETSNLGLSSSIFDVFFTPISCSSRGISSNLTHLLYFLVQFSWPISGVSWRSRVHLVTNLGPSRGHLVKIS